MEKELAQSDLPSKKKVPNTIRKTIFAESGIFGWYLGLFSYNPHHLHHHFHHVFFLGTVLNVCMIYG